MKALRFDGQRAALEDIARPDRADEALIRVRSVGVCNTDLEIIRGYAGFRGTLGHEFVGVVERAPGDALVGERVVGEINCGCGACGSCLGGDARHCRNRTVLGIVGRDGAMAEYVSLPVRNLLRVPDSVPDQHAVFVEPLAAACEVLEQVPVARDMRVALIGDGKLGVLIGQVLATTGASVTAFGRHAAKLAILERKGVDTRFSADYIDDDGRAIPEVFWGFDLVVEASGSAGGFVFAQQIVRPRGTIVLKSTIHGDVPFDATSLIVNEVTLVGSRCGRFERALEMLECGLVDLDPMIAGRMSLQDGAEVLNRAESSGTLKVIVDC